MFEYHGWIALRRTAAYDDPPPEVERGLENEMLGRVRHELAALALGTGEARLTTSNGSHFVSIHGLNNHRNPAVVPFFERAGEIAPGSYGVLYTQDGENDEDWRRRTMVRGRLLPSERVDAFSPVIGALEDPAPE
ncbi:MAG TPA: Imm7 family immunity protein [Solirubrobacteraceae bacterium]